MKNSVWWKEQQGRGEKGEAISIRGEETGYPTMAPMPDPSLGPEQHQQLGWCLELCILSQVCCSSLDEPSCPPPLTVAPPCVTALWFGHSWVGRAKGSCSVGISMSTGGATTPQPFVPGPCRTLGLAGLTLTLVVAPVAAAFSPLSLALSPPLSLLLLLSRLRSSFLGSVQLADTFATDGWCTRRQLSLPICGPLRDSGADAF